MAERPWHNCSQHLQCAPKPAKPVSMAERPWHNCSLPSSRAWEGYRNVSMAERPWHNCSETAEQLNMTYPDWYPWPKGRGTIAASGSEYFPSQSLKYPWPKGRGTIAAVQRLGPRRRDNRVSMAERPWHNCSYKLSTNTSRSSSVSMAERPWHNCSLPFCLPLSTAVLVSMAERPWHNCSRRKSVSPAGILERIHGRKAVAQLQPGQTLCLVERLRPVSMAERPWHEYSVTHNLPPRISGTGIHGRERPAAQLQRRGNPTWRSIVGYPWPKGRALPLQPGRLARLGRQPESGRKAVAQLQRLDSSIDPGADVVAGIHGRKAVAQYSPQ